MLVLKVIKKALADGDVSMIKDIIDRIDGKPNQPIGLEHGGKIILEDIPLTEAEKKAIQDYKNLRDKRIDEEINKMPDDINEVLKK